MEDGDRMQLPTTLPPPPPEPVSRAYADLLVHVFVTPDQLRAWLARAEQLMEMRIRTNCVIAELPIHPMPPQPTTISHHVRIVFDQSAHPMHAKDPCEPTPKPTTNT